MCLVAQDYAALYTRSMPISVTPRKCTKYSQSSCQWPKVPQNPIQVHLRWAQWAPPSPVMGSSGILRHLARELQLVMGIPVCFLNSKHMFLGPQLPISDSAVESTTGKLQPMAGHRIKSKQELLLQRPLISIAPFATMPLVGPTMVIIFLFRSCPVEAWIECHRLSLRKKIQKGRSVGGMPEHEQWHPQFLPEWIEHGGGLF